MNYHTATFVLVGKHGWAECIVILSVMSVYLPVCLCKIVSLFPVSKFGTDFA